MKLQTKLQIPEHRTVGVLGLIVIGLLIAGAAGAATVTVTGTNPTTNTDASAIPASGPGSLTNLRIEYGTCSAPGVFGTAVGSINRTPAAPGAQFSHTINLDPGTSCVRAFVRNTFSIESDPSNVAVKVIDPPKPGPPVLTTTAPQAFDVVPNERTFAFERGRQVGTIKLGAACDEERTTGDDFYALERPSRVKLTRNPRSTALVARCGPATGENSGANSQPPAVEALDPRGELLVGSGPHQTT